MESIYSKISRLAKLTGLLFVVSYGLGFVIWNTHLGKFGYFELELLQTRFLSAGLLALIFLLTIIIVPALLVPRKLRTRIYSFFKTHKFYTFTLSIYATLAFIFLFTHLIFPQVPQNFGGSQPFVKWIIADPEEVKFLRNLDIEFEKNADQPPIQTVPVCEIYSNQEIVIIGNTPPGGPGMRVISLNRDNLKGYQAIPPRYDRSARREKCAAFVLTL